MILLLIILIILFIIFYSIPHHKKIENMEQNSALDDCFYYCNKTNLGEQKCMRMCDNWVFYLSSAGRMKCPPFIPKEICSIHSRF